MALVPLRVWSKLCVVARKEQQYLPEESHWNTDYALISTVEESPDGSIIHLLKSVRFAHVLSDRFRNDSCLPAIVFFPLPQLHSWLGSISQARATASPNGAASDCCKRRDRALVSTRSALDYGALMGLARWSVSHLLSWPLRAGRSRACCVFSSSPAAPTMRRLRSEDECD